MANKNIDQLPFLKQRKAEALPESPLDTLVMSADCASGSEPFFGVIHRPFEGEVKGKR
jgi:hypothetical protein